MQNSNGITDKAAALLSERAGTSKVCNLATTAADLQAEREGHLPVWVRANTRGPEHFSSIGRSKLYELAGKGLIRSVSIRQPGQVKGTRLFHLQSVLDYIASCEVAQ